MAQQNSSLRFDHREIAVIFSLFIFVALLMFTVGIMVGKGLAQARYEGTSGANTHSSDRSPTALAPSEHQEHGDNTGSSLMTGQEEKPAHGEEHADNHTAPAKEEHGEKSAIHHDEAPEKVEHAQATPSAHGEKVADSHGAAKEEAPTLEVEKKSLELIPKKTKSPDVRTSMHSYPENAETKSILKDPKLSDIFENEHGKKTVKHDAPQGNRAPASFGEGNYTIQVGSYSNQKEAQERVEGLKKLGFPFAYFSAKELENQGTWYRVWLGYYKDYESAKSSGDLLQSRGEVKSYIVKRTEPNSTQN